METRLSGRTLTLARAAWGFSAALTVGLFIASLPTYYSQLLTACAGSECAVGQLTPEGMTALRELGYSSAFYAAYLTVFKAVWAMVWWTIAGVLIWRASGDRMALFVAFTFLAFGATLPAVLEALASAMPVWQWPVQLIGFLGFAFAILFLYTFPDGHFTPRWTGWLAVMWIALDAHGVFVPHSPFLGDTWISAFVFVTFASASVVVQIYRYRRVSSPTQRQQTKWVVFGMTTGLVITVLFAIVYNLVLSSSKQNPIANLIGSTITYTVLLLMPLSVGIAVLRHRLWHIDPIINRTLVYGALTMGVVSLYSVIVVGVGALFAGWGETISPLLPLLATGLIAVLFRPAYDLLKRGVNRLMYGERDEPYRVLTRLGQRLESAMAPSAALSLTVETVAHALKLPYVTIALKREGAVQLVAAYGASQNGLTRLPLAYAGETIGELAAASRAPNEPLTPADQRLLSDLAKHISITAHAALLAADLERAHLRIVAEREEARRRLGNDLHDGVGHQLAGLARQAEKATGLLGRDPTAARDLLTQVTQGLDAAISQVRGLAHQLHPPELELLGLAGALRERVQTLAGLALRLDAPKTLPPLPTAIETAAYYIALEALTNVEKHAGAKSCHIRLALSNGNSVLHPSMLELDITDDGRGLPPEAARGLGLLSMQARAAEVGGICRIESTQQAGTRVSARLPCPVHLE